MVTLIKKTSEKAVFRTTSDSYFTILAGEEVDAAFTVYKSKFVKTGSIDKRQGKCMTEDVHLQPLSLKEKLVMTWNVLRS